MYNERHEARRLDAVQKDISGAKERLADERRFERDMKEWSPHSKSGDDSNIVKMRRDIYGS